jgi:hypothetical protein
VYATEAVLLPPKAVCRDRRAQEARAVSILVERVGSGDGRIMVLAMKEAANLFMAFEPPAGRQYVEATERKRAADFARLLLGRMRRTHGSAAMNHETPQVMSLP